MLDTPSPSILITGCSSGIGYCAASTLRRRGYRVIATARREESVAQLRAEGFTSLRLDLEDSASIEQAVEQALALCDGRIDALFNNGAYGIPGAVEDLSREALRRQFETNVFGWHELTRCLLPVMRAQGHGRIVQNSSVLGFVAMPFRGAYNASKFAIEGLSDTLRLELRGTNIHVCLIEPGPITSRFRENALRALQRHIDIENSIHRDAYRAVLQRLEKKGPAAPFTLPPDAVVAKLIHALESPRPRARYAVTVPTVAFALLKRLLGSRQLDALLAKAGSDGKR